MDKVTPLRFECNADDCPERIIVPFGMLSEEEDEFMREAGWFVDWNALPYHVLCPHHKKVEGV